MGAFLMMQNNLRAGAAFFGLALLLGGCTVGPDFHLPWVPDQKAYRAGPESDTAGEQHLDLGKQISGDWWRLYHSGPLTDVVEQAMAGNKTIVAAAASLAQARDVVTEATGALLPQVDANAAASRQRISPSQFGLSQLPAGFPPIFNSFSVGARVSYALDIFGGTRRSIEQAGALAEAADYQLDAAYLTLTGNAVNLAFTIAGINAQIRTVEGIIRDDDTNLRLVNDEVNAGTATQLDIETARSQLAADRTLLPPLRQQLSQSRHALAILSGKAPVDWTPPDFELADLTLPTDLPVSLPSALVRQRPDVLAAEAQLHAASAAIGVATAQLYPNLTLTAALSQEALSPGKLFWGASNVWSVGSGLTAPLFHGGELEAARRAAEDAYNAAVADYEQTVLQSFGQVADVLDALQNDADLVAEQRRAATAAESSLKLTRTAYTAGSVSVLQVVDAQRVAEQARLGYDRAQTQRLMDTAQLFLAMGGGWWNLQPHSTGTPAGGGAAANVQPASAPAK
jgi:NodT family efflux transporter outer membrane factor (OMF) lipoprotein